MRKHVAPQEQAGAAPLQKAQKQLDGALQFVDQALRPVSSYHVSKPPVAAESKKRKRASPFGRNDKDFAEQLSMPGTPTTDLLPLFKGELRNYQLQGIKWLYAMYTNGLSSVLADESPDDRKAQVAGLLSCLRSRGTCGPILLVTPAQTHTHWATELLRILGKDGVLTHALPSSGGPLSQRALDALSSFCRSAGHLPGTRATDPNAMAPTSLVICSIQALVAHQQVLAQHAFRFIVVDLIPPDAQDNQRDTSPCASHVGSPTASHHNHPAARRHSVSFPAVGAARATRAALQPLPQLQQHDFQQPLQSAVAGAGGVPGTVGASNAQPHQRPATRRHSGPITRSASVGGCVATGMQGGEGGGPGSYVDDDDPSHAQLVLSLSRLSSSGAHEDEAVSHGPSSSHGGSGRTGAAHRGGSTCGPFGAVSNAATTAAPAAGTAAAACLRPPRPASLRSHSGGAAALVAVSTIPHPPPPVAFDVAMPTLTSVASWPMNAHAGLDSMAQDGMLGAGGAGAGLFMGGDAYARLSAPVTRKRSMSVAALAEAAAAAAAAVAAATPEEAEGQLLSMRHVQALRTVRPGAGAVMLLADGPMIEGLCGPDLWPMLSCLLPTLVQPLMASVEEAVQAPCVAPTQASSLMDQTRALLMRFVLHRGSGSTSLDSLRGQGAECNLYDLFACAD